MTMRFSTPSRLPGALILALLLCAGSATSRADSVATNENQLWLVDTRGAPSRNASVGQVACLKYWRCDLGRQWHVTSLPDLLGSDDPTVTTLIYVHENRVTRSESFQRACTVFSSLSRRIPDGQSFRMIAMSWPSDRIGILPRPDAQTKARRSEAHGLYLAWLIDQIHPDVSVGMFGMSYGPRVITAALHHLGNGSIEGRCLQGRAHPTRKPIRVALAAAALDAHWLQPGQRHGQAFSQIDTALVLINPRDSALKWYPRLYGRRGAPALGYVGLGSKRFNLPNPDRISECNVSRQVAGTHSWRVYEGSPSMLARMVDHLVQ